MCNNMFIILKFKVLGYYCTHLYNSEEHYLFLRIKSAKEHAIQFFIHITETKVELRESSFELCCFVETIFNLQNHTDFSHKNGLPRWYLGYYIGFIVAVGGSPRQL